MGIPLGCDDGRSSVSVSAEAASSPLYNLLEKIVFVRQPMMIIVPIMQFQNRATNSFMLLM